MRGVPVPVVMVVPMIMPVAVPSVALQGNNRSGSHHREGGRGMGHLRVLGHLVGCQYRHAHAGQHLVGPNRRLEGAR